MNTHTLTLTDDQAEILGYALSLARRDQITKSREAGIGPTALGYEARAARIEEVRDLLDRCPVTEAL